MKVKQLLKHFWHGNSTIETVQILRMRDHLDTLNYRDLCAGDYGQYANESISIFQINDKVMKIWIKVT